MSNFISITAIATKDNRKEKFIMNISKPIISDHDCFCEIEAPLLFKGIKSIHGADNDQAKELSIAFVKKMVNYSNWKLTHIVGENADLLMRD